MDPETPATSSQFSPGDLIWAKMKGFPPWPARILSPSEATPAGRIPVVFFGTQETAFMKASDISDYLSNKAQHEVPRKQKGFNEGIHEIRVAAGLESPSYRDPAYFGNPEQNRSPSPPSDRRPVSRTLTDVFLDTLAVKRSPSASTRSRSRASSTASALKLIRQQLQKRRRVDSESSNGSRRNKMISGFGFNPEHLDTGDLFLNDDHPLADDARSTRSKRSRNSSSKVFEDYIFGQLPGRSRHRSGSTSDGGRGRHRLMSGVSDVFDELLMSSTHDMGLAAENLLNTLDELPSESSEIPFFDRSGTPEMLAPLPGPSVFCSFCGSECNQHGTRWRCTSKHCMKWNEPNSIDAPSTSAANAMVELSNTTVDSKPTILSLDIKEESSLDNESSQERNEDKKPSLINRKVKTESNDEGTSKTKPLRRKVQVISPRRISLEPSKRTKEAKESPDPKRPTGRPNKYKVEKTPPMEANGVRLCSFCNGQVRPQMCGGNKHRWRCVDKKCRKWYGWVKSSDEIPRDLGRKGRFNSVIQKIKLKKKKEAKKEKEVIKPTIEIPPPEPASISSAGEAAAAAAALELSSRRSDATGRSSPVQRMFMSFNRKQEELKKKGRPTKPEAKIKLKPQGKMKEEKRPLKRKQPKKKEEPEMPQRPISPLTDREMRFRPCAMEKRARWWTSEKRKIDLSPEREFSTAPADAAAAFRMISLACRSAAVTRADEPGTVNGSLDLLMDTLIGCMAPLFSLLSKLPNMKPEQEVLQRLWDASAVHLPTFQ